MSTEVELSDPEAFSAGLAAVRDDDTAINWALVGHPDDNINHLSLEDTGAGGLEELLDRLMDTKAQYALVRLVDTFDMSTTVKFVYVRWRGPNLGFRIGSKLGIVGGSIEEKFHPYHTVIETDSKEDLTDESVMTKLQEQSGQRSKVLEATVAKTRQERGFTAGTTTKADSTGSAPTQAGRMDKVGKMGSSFTGMSGMAKASGGMKIDPSLSEAVQCVATDEENIKWCIAGYVDNNPKNPLTVVSTSEGTLDEFVAVFASDSVTNQILYGYVRVADEVDGINTVKFAYVQWVGEGVRPMAKAKASTQKGALECCFKPFHVSVYANSSNEVTSRIIQDKVASASGSKINIMP